MRGWNYRFICVGSEVLSPSLFLFALSPNNLQWPLLLLLLSWKVSVWFSISCFKRHSLHLLVKDLAEVLQLLRRHGYSGVKCFDLGLYLGLSPATLDAIMLNHKGDIESCLRECLAKWLQKADEVQEKGGPSIYSLLSALRKIGMNGVADKIDMNSEFILNTLYLLCFIILEHPACKILARYTSKQSLVSALSQLVLVLYGAQLIKEMILPAKKQGKALLQEVKEAVCVDYRKLKAFADILCKITTTAKIGNAIMKQYGKYYKCNYKNCNCFIDNNDDLKEVQADGKNKFSCSSQ